MAVTLRRAVGACESSDSHALHSAAIGFRSHVFVAEHGGHVVVLDLRRDRYVFARGQLGSELLKLFRAGSLPPKTLSAGTRAALDRWEWSTSNPRRTDLRSAPMPERALTDSSLCFRESRTIAASLGACAKADFMLRSVPLRTLVEMHRRRAARASFTALPDRDALALRLREFRSARTIYPRKPSCMFDSLALCLYLQRHSIYPAWIYGVQAAPFRAHCWLQLDDLVIDDTVERVSRFTRIMVC